MGSNKYFIRSDYIENPPATFDCDAEVYWDERRAINAASYQYAVYLWAEKIVRLNGFKTLADLGCGAAVKFARLHKHMPNLDYVGYDQPSAISLCRSRYKFGQWIAVNFEHPADIERREFDLVIASDVIEHLENPKNIFDCIDRLSSNNTYVLISTPERVLLRGTSCICSPIRHHVREWSQPEFSCYVQSLGWQILETRILPGFDCFSSFSFFQRAVRRWMQMKTIRYTQALLIKKS